MRNKLIQVLALASMGIAQTTMAADTGSTTPPRMERHLHFRSPASIERAAMNNLLAGELAQSTGRDVAEISKLLEGSPPPEVANELGVSRETMTQAMQTAHTSLIQKVLAAGLITEAQAEKLSSMPPPHLPQ